MNQNNDMESFDPTQDDQLQKELDEALGDKSVEELMAEAEAADQAAQAAQAPARGLSLTRA